MMEFEFMADPRDHFQVIAFELANDGLSAHYQWQLTVRCQSSHTSLLRQWGCVRVCNGFGQRYWHGCITRQTEYGFCQGWYYWQMTLASPLAVLARRVMSQTWIAQSAVMILKQTLEQTGWRDGIDFFITVKKTAAVLPLVIRYNESSLSFIDRLCTQCGWIFYWRQTAQHWCLHIADQLPKDFIELKAVNVTGLLRPQPTLIQLTHAYYWGVDRIHWQMPNATQPRHPLQYASANQTELPGYQTSQWITQQPPAVELWQQQLDWQRQLSWAISDAVQLAPGQLIRVIEDEQTVNGYRVLQVTAQGEWFSCFHAGDTLPQALARQLADPHGSHMGSQTRMKSLTDQSLAFECDTGFWPRLILYPADCDYRKPNEFTVQRETLSAIDPQREMDDLPGHTSLSAGDAVCSGYCRINPSLPNTLLTQTVNRSTHEPVLSDNGDYYVQWLFERSSKHTPICLLPVAHLNQFHWPHYPNTTLMVHCFAHEVTPRFCIIGALPNQTVTDVLTTQAVTPALTRQHNQMTWQVDEAAMTWSGLKQHVQLILPRRTETAMKFNARRGEIYFASDHHGQLGCELNLLAQAATFRCTAGRHQGWRTQEGHIEITAGRQLWLRAGLNVMGFAKETMFVTAKQQCQWSASGHMHWLAEQELAVYSQKQIQLNYQMHAHWCADQQGIRLSSGLGGLRLNPLAIQLAADLIDFNAGVIYLYTS